MKAEIIADICRSERALKNAELAAKYDLSEREIRLLLHEIQTDPNIKVPIMSTEQGYVMPRNKEQSEAGIRFLECQFKSRLRKVKALKQKHNHFFTDQLELNG